MSACLPLSKLNHSLLSFVSHSLKTESFSSAVRSSLKDVLIHNVDVSSRVMISTALMMAFLCRVARTWNQTGDKWAHLADVSDWLVRQVLVLL